MRQLIIIIILLFVLPTLGTIGFQIIEGWGFIDSLYMSIITLSTVGYEVAHPLSPEGKVFVVAYIVISLSIVVYSITKIGEMAVGGELKMMIKKRIMQQRIKGMSNHFIICGVGRMGSAICTQLQNAGHTFVVIEKCPERVGFANEKKWHCIEGDATNDEILKIANLSEARCLTCVMPNDSDNLFTVMSARLLNPSIQIISRANDESAVDKLRRAGANKIVNPYSTGAVKISQLMINPKLDDFIEILGEGNLGIDLTLLHIDPASQLIGKTVNDIDVSNKNVAIVGIKTSDNKLLLPAPIDHRLTIHDSIIAVAKTMALKEFLEHWSGSQTS